MRKLLRKPALLFVGLLLGLMGVPAFAKKIPCLAFFNKLDQFDARFAEMGIAMEGGKTHICAVVSMVHALKAFAQKMKKPLPAKTDPFAHVEHIVKELYPAKVAGQGDPERIFKVGLRASEQVTLIENYFRENGFNVEATIGFWDPYEMGPDDPTVYVVRYIAWDEKDVASVKCPFREQTWCKVDEAKAKGTHSMFLGAFDPKTLEMTLVNAGTGEKMVRNARGKRVGLLQERGVFPAYELQVKSTGPRYFVDSMIRIRARGCAICD